MRPILTSSTLAFETPALGKDFTLPPLCTGEYLTCVPGSGYVCQHFAPIPSKIIRLLAARHVDLLLAVSLSAASLSLVTPLVGENVRLPFSHLLRRVAARAFPRFEPQG